MTTDVEAESREGVELGFDSLFLFTILDTVYRNPYNVQYYPRSIPRLAVQINCPIDPNTMYYGMHPCPKAYACLLSKYVIVYPAFWRRRM